VGFVFKRKRMDARASGWYVEFSHGGKRIRRLAKGAETKTEAKAFLREIERKIDRGEFVTKKKTEVLFQVWAKRYLEWSKLNKRSWKRDQTSLRQLIPFFKGKLLKNITPFMIEDYKKKRRANVEAATVNRELSCLKHMLNMAINEGILSQNPVKKVRFFREREIKYRLLAPSEKKRLIQEAHGYLKVVLVIALFTGMRKGEILNLKWNQVDFSRGYISVKKTKSGRSRTIPMNSVVTAVLKQWAENNDHDEFLFWNRKTQQPLNSVRKAFLSAWDAAGVDNLKFHTLRDTISHLLSLRMV
jgi:integrase